MERWIIASLLLTSSLRENGEWISQLTSYSRLSKELTSGSQAKGHSRRCRISVLSRASLWEITAGGAE